MKELSRSVRVAWLCGYPSHYFRKLHCDIEKANPGQTKFFYLRNSTVEQRGYEVGVIPENSAVLDPKDVMGLLRKLRQFDPSLLVTSGNYPRIVVAAALWAKVTGRRVAYLCDTNFKDVTRRSKTWRALKKVSSRIYLRQMWCLLPIGIRNREFYAWCCGDEWAREHEVHFPLPHTVSQFCIPESCCEQMSNDSRINLLYLGRLSPEKGIENLIHGFALLPKNIVSDFQCDIAGDGSCRKSLEAMRKAAGLESRVRFLGSIPSDKTADLLRAHDVCVLPSQVEPWGLVVNEALSSEKPVVVPEWVGSVPDLVIDDVNGFVIPDNLPSSIALGLQRVHANRSRLQEMGRRGREIILQGRWNDLGSLAAWKTMLGRLDARSVVASQPDPRSEARGA
jgi:glycosyltransferase involved in cell wall biosynthesis